MARALKRMAEKSGPGPAGLGAIDNDRFAIARPARKQNGSAVLVVFPRVGSRIGEG